jgi:hypothetical protein
VELDISPGFASSTSPVQRASPLPKHIPYFGACYDNPENTVQGPIKGIVWYKTCETICGYSSSPHLRVSNNGYSCSSETSPSYLVWMKVSVLLGETSCSLVKR